jgi:hypothetical protein
LKKRRLALYGGALLLILIGGGSLYEVRSESFRDLALHYIQSLCDRRIEVGEASFNLLGRVTLRDVRIHNPPGYSTPLFFTAPKIVFHLGMTGGETSAFRPTRISIHDPTFHYERTDSLPWNSEGLWTKSPPRHDHPTFILPVAIRNAEVHYADSRVGHAGIRLSLPRINAEFSVFSDGAEIKNRLTATGVAVPGGGVMDVIFSSHPNANHSEATLTLRRVNLKTVAPFYDFLTLFSIERGLVSGPWRLEFDSPQITRSSADLTLADLSIRHRPSGAFFERAEAGVAFASTAGETEFVLSNLAVRWRRSRVDGEGRFSTRHAPHIFSDMRFSATEARAEDLSFLLCSPDLTATGPVGGECRISGNGGQDEYTTRIDLSRAEVGFGGFLAKPAGINGRLFLRGRGGERVESIDVELASSRGRLTPMGNGWALRGEKIKAEDARRHILPLAALPDITLSGEADLELRFQPGGVIGGRADLTGLGLATGIGLVKPEGRPMRVDAEAVVSPRGIVARHCRIELGDDRVTLEGRRLDGATRIGIGLDAMDWEAVRTYAPGIFRGLDARFKPTGDFSGSVSFERRAGEAISEYAIRLELVKTRFEIEGFGAKPRGLAANLSIVGQPKEDGFNIGKGNATIGNTRLAVEGDWSGPALDLRLKGTATGLDGLRALLASQLWPGFSQLESTGGSNLDVAISGRGGALKVSADLDGTAAAFFYGDTWYKPAGEAFRVRLMMQHAEEGTLIERLEFVQGTSRFFSSGRIGKGRPAAIEATIRADLDVASFKTRAPALERIRIERRKASDALTMIAEPNGRATLNWQLSGTIEEPRLSLMMESIVNRALANAIAAQLKGISRIITAPFRLGGEMIRDVLGADTPGVRADSDMNGFQESR